MRDLLIVAGLTVAAGGIVWPAVRFIGASDFAHDGASVDYADELHEWSETTVELPTPSGTGWPVGSAYSAGGAR